MSSILFFNAIQTEVTCSAAFAYQIDVNSYRMIRERVMNRLTTMGNRIRPMKGFGMWYRSAVSSIDATTTGNRLQRMTRDGRSRLHVQ